MTPRRKPFDHPRPSPNQGFSCCPHWKNDSLLKTIFHKCSLEIFLVEQFYDFSWASIGRFSKIFQDEFFRGRCILSRESGLGYKERGAERQRHFVAEKPDKEEEKLDRSDRTKTALQTYLLSKFAKRIHLRELSQPTKDKRDNMLETRAYRCIFFLFFFW
jgi:hypothetical protein